MKNILLSFVFCIFLSCGITPAKSRREAHVITSVERIANEAVYPFEPLYKVTLDDSTTFNTVMKHYVGDTVTYIIYTGSADTFVIYR